MRQKPTVPETLFYICLGFIILGVGFHTSDIQQNPTLAHSQQNQIIHAEHFQQFWLWTPPQEDSKLNQAHTLYLLQGEIRPPTTRPDIVDNTDNDDVGNTPNVAPMATLTPQGLGVRHIADKQVWLVYRTTSQDWSPVVMPQLIARLHQWQEAGNQVKGIQIDYDAPTYQLGAYAALLKRIREQLPQHYQLSVTGLLDWANQVDDPQFVEMGQAIDELVMQTYQGTTTLPNYAQYLKKLEQVPFDFKVGIIEGGRWQGAKFVESNPHFNGYVVFLR